MSSINLEEYFKNPHVKFNNAKIKKNSKPPIELLLPSFILYLANKPENATKTQLIYHLDTHKFSGYTVKKQNIFTSNFTGNLNFKIGDETTIEINSTFQTKDLDKLVKVINSDIELQNDYNQEQKEQLYHIINCKRLLYALTEYNKIRSSNKDEKDESNLHKILGNSLGKALTNPSNENPSDKLPSNENPSNENSSNESLKKSLKKGLEKGLEKNLTIQNLYNILEQSLTVTASTATHHSINDDSNKILLLKNTQNSPNFQNMKQFFTLIVDTNFSSNAEALKNRYLVNEENILSFYNIIYNLEIDNSSNKMQLTLNTIEQIKR